MNHVTDHADRAVARVPAFQRSKTSIVSIARAVSGSVQEAEDLFLGILAIPVLASATGRTLDVIGRLVGQGRGAMDDAIYRTWIGARLAINRSSGTVPELISVVKTVAAAGVVTKVTESYPAALTVQASGVAIPNGDQIAALVHATRAGGVRVVFEWTPSSPAYTFRLDAGPGLDVANLSGALY